MRVTFLLPIAATVAAWLMPCAARAEIQPSTPVADEAQSASIIEVEGHMAGMAVVSDEELSNQRGGFVVAGMDVRLGAEMRTYMDGALVLQTIVNWDDTGIRSEQIYSGALTPSSLAAIQGGIAAGSGSTESPLYLANNGQTALSQSVDGAIQNIIVNRASGVAFSQETRATIDIAGYRNFQNDVLSQRVIDSLGGAMGAASLNALGQ